MANAYAELEKKMSSGQPEEQPTQEQVEQATGLSLDPYYNEYAENGVLSDDSYQKLQASGLNRELVDSYIQGQQALADATVQSIYQAAGGQEKYTAADWASKNLSDLSKQTLMKLWKRVVSKLLLLQLKVCVLSMMRNLVFNKFNARSKR